ncbi:MAG: CYTH domain-containing protein [Candidatus Aminicenantes bacterium]|nr:CYTH domain-containing protein [Candidatus Aminicenantes bacterium]
MAKNTVLSHLSLDLPKTRIMATIGPANYNKKQLKGMLDNGATIFRFNAARINKGIFEFKKKIEVSTVLEDINLLSEARRQPITTSLDLAGPKVRVEKIISIHKREEKPNKDKTQDPPENHPDIGDIVYLYSDDVDWNDNSIKKTLGSLDPSIFKPAGPDDTGNKESGKRPACIDETWRLQTKIHSFKTVDKYISAKDGKCNLHIEERDPHDKFVKARVEEVSNDFFFSSTQGINPKGYMFPEILSIKDFKDFEWALEHDFDLICVSFVCSPLEFFELKKKMVEQKKESKRDDWEPPLIFAKIETTFTVDAAKAKNYCDKKRLKERETYIDKVLETDHDSYRKLISLYEKDPIKAICETFDGVMVARGDLAVEADKYCVPFYQKAIVEACRLSNKPVIIATEVLESMSKGNPSTRAEIGDIATAVLDGADVVMLAGEVASTKSDPVKVVKELKTAIHKAEKAEEEEMWLQNPGDVRYFHERFSRLLHRGESHLKEMKKLQLLSSKTVESDRWKIGMGSRVCLAARAKDAGAIFVSVTTGATARYISYFRPVQGIISIGSSMEVARRLLLCKGIYPVVMQYPLKHELKDFILIAREIHSVIRVKPTKGWESKKEIVIPGLLRIEPRLEEKKEKRLLPTTVHEIPLPNPPVSIPEREIKYILNEKYHKILKNYLINRYQAKHINQKNYYFYDESGVIMDNKAMVRIRIEKIDQKPERAILTIKKKSVKKEGGTEERWEKEFHVTRYFFANCSSDQKTVSFDRLPGFFRAFLWDEFKEAFISKNIESSDKIVSKNVAVMSNTRLTVETHSDLNLELDAFITKPDRNYYELEIETIAAEEKNRDEHIELLFKSLGIPIVIHKYYPTKFVRTLLDFGILTMNDKFKEAIDSVANQLDSSSTS